MSSKLATVAALREHLKRVAPARVQPARLDMVEPNLERALGGWPRPGLSLVHGAPGVGRLGLVLPLMIQLTQEGHNVGVVDPVGWLHPPGLPEVRLSKLLLVRPGAGRAAWAAEQLARSGAMPLVLLLDPPPLGRGGRRLQRAAEEGHTSLILLAERVESDLPVSLRLSMCSPEQVVVERGGRQPPGTRIRLGGGPPMARPTSNHSPASSR